MKIYAFDVDETLEISGGPVTLWSIDVLRVEGHVVGLCGNWPLALLKIENCCERFSFFGGPLGKAGFLRALQGASPSLEVVMVGNDPSRAPCWSFDDAAAAREADVRFIDEEAFAKGMR